MAKKLCNISIERYSVAVRFRRMDFLCVEQHSKSHCVWLLDFGIVSLVWWPVDMISMLLWSSCDYLKFMIWKKRNTFVKSMNRYADIFPQL